MTCTREIDVGAYVLDVLEPEDRLRMREHLAQCAACRASLRDLEGLPRLLAQVPAPEIEHRERTETPSELAFRRLHLRAVGGRPAGRPRGPRRWVLVAAAAAVVGVVGGVGGIVAAVGSPAPVSVSASQGEVRAQAQLRPLGGGTTVTLALHGVESGERCQLMVVSRDGRWEKASDWTATYSGTAEVVGSVPIKPQDIQKLVIRTPDGRTLLTMPS